MKKQKTLKKQKTVKSPPGKELNTWKQPPKKRLSVRQKFTKDLAAKGTDQTKKVRGPLKKSQTVRRFAAKLDEEQNKSLTKHTNTLEKKQSVKRTNTLSTRKDTQLKRTSSKSSLKRQDTLQLTGETSGGIKRGLSRGLTRTPSLTLGNDELYVPSAVLWPVKMVKSSSFSIVFKI